MEGLQSSRIFQLSFFVNYALLQFVLHKIQISVESLCLLDDFAAI